MSVQGEMCIAELARSLAKVTGFSGRISYDRSRPDRTLRKLLDVSRLAAMGWRSKIALEQGIGRTYEWFLQNAGSARR